MRIPRLLADEGYTFVDSAGEGGKSITAVIENEGSKYLLKLPKKAELSREEQFRFRKEAEALALLGGNGTPEVYKYDFDGNEPFILMQFIEGDTLTKVVGGKPLTIDHAIDLLFQILSIIGTVHELELHHRDIKPDNIIVSPSGQITLIDFGLCRMHLDDGFKTPAGTELGNRFLRLPELAKGDKTPSHVSDITFCVGLLFFMLSGKAPNQLLDERARYPHQRSSISKELEGTKWLAYTFDRGFAYDISHRFQSASELKEFIERWRNDEMSTNDENAADEFSRFLSSADFQRKDKINQTMLEAHKAFLTAAAETLNADLSTGGSGPNPDANFGAVITKFFVHRINTSRPVSTYGITSSVSDDYTTISYVCHVNGSKISAGSHLTSEGGRIADDYTEMGKKCCNKAIKDLIEMLKSLR